MTRIPPTPDTWLIEHGDSVGRYLVASQNKEGKYMVDLLAYETRGECACPAWQYRIGPVLQKGEVPDRPWCKHIQAARDHFTDEILRRTLAGMRSGL